MSGGFSSRVHKFDSRRGINNPSAVRPNRDDPSVLGADRIVVIHESGTAWWVPLTIGLGVAVAAALSSYAAAWWFKKRDVDRENAFKAVTLVDEAEQIAARSERFDAEGGLVAVTRLLQEARVRAQPLASDELDDRFEAALNYAFSLGLWQQQPVGGRRWLSEAVANIREGLNGFLAAPSFVPFRKRLALSPSFPTTAELNAMGHGNDGQALMQAIAHWREAHQQQQ